LGGIRLIDAGCVQDKNEPEFFSQVEKDLTDFKEFVIWFIGTELPLWYSILEWDTNNPLDPFTKWDYLAEEFD
jgi:hypothetical protein